MGKTGLTLRPHPRQPWGPRQEGQGSLLGPCLANATAQCSLVEEPTLRTSGMEGSKEQQASLSMGSEHSVPRVPRLPMPHPVPHVMPGAQCSGGPEDEHTQV